MAFMEKAKAMATRKVLKKNLDHLRSLVASGSASVSPICIACDGSRCGSKEVLLSCILQGAVAAYSPPQ
eukprot:7338848-Prorocentrum_lima.AAC.1